MFDSSFKEFEVCGQKAMFCWSIFYPCLLYFTVNAGNTKKRKS